MTSQEMADRILDLIACNGDATFPQIVDSIGDEARGDHALELAPNTIAWAGISKAFLDAFALAKDKLEVHRTNFLINAIDGAILKFPLAKCLRKGGHKRPHWIPVIFLYRDKKETTERRASVMRRRSGPGKSC